MAIPKVIRIQERKTRKRGKTAILTESPYKNDLFSAINITKNRSKKIKINKLDTDKKISEKKKTKKNLKRKRLKTIA